MRTSWDVYFIEMAKLAATRATCRRAQHGAILVQDRAVISTGYNGAPRSIESCDERPSCFRESSGIKPGTQYELCHAVHAEQNAICLAAKNGHRTEGTTIYVTGLPCLICTRLIINAGISKVVCAATGRYNDLGTLQLFEQAGITVTVT